MKLNNFTLLTSIISLATVLSLGSVQSQDTAESTESADVTENVKKRIEEVVKSKETAIASKIAYVGSLESIANETLSILTDDGIKLASMSADVTVYDLEEEEELASDDLSIGDYISALGFVNGDDVLDTRRILVDVAPAQNLTKVFYGIITQVDVEGLTIQLTQPRTQETLLITVDKQSLLEYFDATGARVELDDFEDIVSNVPAMVLYQLPEDETDNPVIDSLLYALSIQSAQDKPEASVSGELNEDTPVEDIIPQDLQ